MLIKEAYDVLYNAERRSAFDRKQLVCLKTFL